MTHAVTLGTEELEQRTQDDLFTLFPALEATLRDTTSPACVVSLDGQRVYANSLGEKLLGDGIDHTALCERRALLDEMLAELSRLGRPTQRHTRLDGRWCS